MDTRHSQKHIQDHVFEIGDKVVTSGLPGGLKIGVVIQYWHFSLGDTIATWILFEDKHTLNLYWVRRSTCNVIKDA